ncbi:MAG: hypothetical protein JST00_24600 [Deltaproteobacteria bacterium]|nr:hypothetical protein [Deltaproteobacteria bacterium]
MKRTPALGLAVSFAVALLACGAKVQEEAKAEPSAPVPVTPTPGADASVDAPVAPTSCGAGLPKLSCATTSAPPTSAAAVAQFVKDNAIPIRCSAGGKSAWDLRPLLELYGDQKIFAIGEVHGTNEIGIVSSLLLDELAAKGLVNVVAFEMPMDLEAPLQRYVDTGSDATADRMLKYFAQNMFGSILTRRAREQQLAGRDLTIAAVDIPQDPMFAVRAIENVAKGLTTQKDAVLTTLPTTIGQPPSQADITSVKSYFDQIIAQKTQICAELSPADCDRLVAMTHALWASTLAYDDGEAQSQLWFARREEVIYYNMKAKMAAPTDRMFLHMGAFHTNKHEASAGSRMANEYALTKGKVFSVAPAYGDGSVIWYGEDVDLPGEPATITGALTDKPSSTFFVSTTRPSPACVGNPLGEEREDTVGVGGTRGDLYDGYIHYGLVTSERRPSEATLSRELGAKGMKEMASLAAFRERIARREKTALGLRR